MNAVRRKVITSIQDQIEALRSELESIKDDEQEYFDNMPDSIQCSGKGDKADAAIAALDEVIDALVDAVDTLESAKE